MQNDTVTPEKELIPDHDSAPIVESINLDSIHAANFQEKVIDVEFLDDDETIVLNVGGVRHETHVSTLRNVPNTRLSNLAEQHAFSSEPKDVYFFDRHPAVFNSIIDFYRTGKYYCYFVTYLFNFVDLQIWWIFRMILRFFSLNIYMYLSQIRL